ncbi:MAG: tail fiber domain-containing protein [Ferruginibacter sp.]
MKKYLLTVIIFFTGGCVPLFCQSFSINTDGSTAHPSAMLDVKSINKGLLTPRMTTAQRTAIVTPATGLQVYDTDLNLLYFFNGSSWASLGASTNFWTLSGGNIYNNTGTNVGIGTTTPGDKLEVNGNIRLTNTATILAGPSSTGSAYSVTLRAGDPFVPVGGSGGSVNITATNNMPSGGSGYSNLGPSGNINLTSGSGYNTAGGNINITAGQTSCWSLTGNSHSDVNIQGGANLVAADASSIAVQGGGTVGVGCPTANANGGNLILRSGIGTGSGTQGNIQLLNGNVGIGTSAPSSKLEVCGNVRVIGTIVASGSITTSAISCPSDLRYKRNITPISNPLEKIMQVNGVNYYWKKADFPNMNFNDKIQVGFIAQDLEKIFPEMVFTDEAGYRSVDYSRLTPVLVETIKEQQKQIDTIIKRLAEIEKLLPR